MLIPWADMQDALLAQVPGCSVHTATDALRLAAQRFCERTRAWRSTMDPLYTASGIDTYDFNISLEQEVVQVVKVKLDGQEIDTLLPEEEGTSRRGLLALNQRQFLLQPVPAADQSLVVTAILKPSNTASGVEDFLYAMYSDALGHGAREILFGMKNQPFNDLAAESDEKAAFDRLVAQAKIKVAKGYSARPLVTRPQFF